MITYVNTVLVSNLASSNLLSAAPTVADAGKFVVITVDEAKSAADSTNTFPYITASNADKYDRIKIGVVTDKTAPKVNPSTGATTYEPIVKWSNVISADSIKSYVESKYAADTEDVANINFRSLNAGLLTTFAVGGKRIIVRLTFKDLPTRYRKWTESYEYVTKEGDTVNSIVKNITNMINKEYKRARVVASLGTATAGAGGAADTIAPTAGGSEDNANAIILTAMQYDDDNSVDSLNWANKVRFNVNLYYTDPAAEGWESTNKHFPAGVEITKTPGKTYQASAKLVRDREAQAMGYQGILNRGEGTWPIIKPAMVTDLSKHYDAITLEFERMYRAADDLQRKTKETVEIYCAKNGSTDSLTALAGVLVAFIGTTTTFE